MYEQYFEDKYNKKPDSIYCYHNLLNFLSNMSLIGQRPCGWWTRSHDIDLIVGTYRFGYANYVEIKKCEEIGFKDLEECINPINFRLQISRFSYSRHDYKKTKEINPIDSET